MVLTISFSGIYLREEKQNNKLSFTKPLSHSQAF